MMRLPLARTYILQRHYPQLGTTPGSWAAVATWRRYFGGASEQGTEREQWQPEGSTSRQLVEKCKAEKIPHYPKYYYWISRDYAQSTFTAFFHETRRAAYLDVGRNNSIRLHRGIGAEEAVGIRHPVAPTVDIPGTSASPTISSLDLRNMFLAQ